jgi:hypothetical protein
MGRMEIGVECDVPVTQDGFVQLAPLRQNIPRLNRA